MTASSLKATEILANIPKELRGELVKAYGNILKNYIEHRWEPSELSGGKLCEVVYTILQGYIDGEFPEKPKKPRNMVDACRGLEQASQSFSRSVRIQIPRMIIALYEIRNNRGVGHVGDEVDPSNMDATVVLYISKWIMAELVRLFHDVDIQKATMAVEQLSERIIPAIWQIDGKYRVLDTSLSMTQKTLLILYQHDKPVVESELINWVEHSNPTVFRRDILGKAHQRKLIEYDSIKKTVQISPKGIQEIEKVLSSIEIE
jgi:hypothetical protein